MDFLVNTIIDYFASNNEMALAIVVKPGVERLQVQSVAKTEKITPRQILTAHGTADGGNLSKLSEIQNAINDAMKEVETDFLWENLLEKGGQFSVEDICQEYFGDKQPINISALARVMLEDNVHFKRVQNQFTVNSREEAEKIETLKRQRAEKAALRERTMKWLSDTLAAKPAESPQPVPEEQETFIANTIDFLLRGANNEAVNLLSAASGKLNVREIAIRMLRNCGRFPEEADEFLLANGIHAGFSRSVLEETDKLDAFPEDSERLDLTKLEAFSIDDEETMEIDDALSCRTESDKTIVGIHIADPAYFVPKDTPIDLAAEDRPLSLYLPTTFVPMFPERLSHDLASLVKGKVRPSLTFTVTFDADGEMDDWTICSAKIKVSHRLTYKEADKMMESGEDSVSDALRKLDVISRKLKQYREEDGAVSLNRPEMKIRVRNDQITVEHIDQETPSHQMVGEFMILANNLAAKYALVHDIPVIYRAQEEPSEPVHPIRRYDPCLFDQMIRRMRRTHLSTYPAPHFGLGLDLYVQVSSPLRRYADLVILRQLSAHFANQPLPYKQEELFSILDNVDSTASQNKSLEREANKFWMLEYIARNCIGQEFDAIVVRQEGNLVLAEIDRLFERGVVYTRDHVRFGERLRVRIRDASSKTGRLAMEMLN
ncbi:MAG: RNB domain-containing ribonuclease [Lentisphaeria bacterium]|nr:RNB domain-containing ribonuclease [Lentisphaeria bacterium]